MISPFRWDVVLTGFALAVPVLLLALRGDFGTDDVVVRLPWCLAAGWAVVALVRWASTPPAPVKPARRGTRPTAAPADTGPAPTA